MNKELVGILACPKCKGPLLLVDGDSLISDNTGLECCQCKLRYKFVTGDVPQLIEAEAEKIE